MDQFPHLKAILNSTSLRIILQSKDLAQLGDFLSNFIYSSVRIGMNGVSGSIHVWDTSLKNAMEIASIRDALGKNTKPDKVADAAEALIAYAYYTNLVTIDEMMQILAKNFDDTKLDRRNKEKEMCAIIFSELLVEIVKRANYDQRFIN